MKRTMIFMIFLISGAAILAPADLRAQCTNCNGTLSLPGMASSALGLKSKASGLTAFASGFHTIASGSKSTAIGSMIYAEGDQSMVLGSNAGSKGYRSMIIGHGFGDQLSERLINNTDNSLVVGFNSIYPTLFISSSPSMMRTGKVGIGNVTNPQAKLHIRAEHGELSGLFVEQSNFRILDVYLGDKEHGFRCTDDDGMIFLTRGHYLFNQGRVGIGTVNPAYDLEVIGSIFSNQFTLYDKEFYKSNIDGWVLRSDSEGNAFWADPSDINDNDWLIHGNNIYRMDGYVGIGTNETYGYKLAVNGGIITEEVTVKISEDWPDYVFGTDYPLMPLGELENYISRNNHLPEMPAAESIIQHGLQLGIMEKLLVKKVEELTLYIIHQDTKLEELETKINLLLPFEE